MNTIIAANWKSHKNREDAKKFWDEIIVQKEMLKTSSVEVLLCPPFSLLSDAIDAVRVHALPISIGAQNVSSFPEGAYTGEIAATQLAGLATHVIIGHSERRDYLQESEHLIEMKIKQAKDAGLTVILCVQDKDATVYEGVDIVAYEPVHAIGTGTPDDPLHVQETLEALFSRYPNVRFLYGGSVNPDTIQQFLAIKHISGFLVGGASLEASSFMELIGICNTKK